MPELPEVEIVRSSLQREFVGKKIKTATVNKGAFVSRHKAVKDFRALAEGRTIKAVQRIGVSLVCSLDNDTHLVISLNGSSQLRKAASAKDEKPKHTHAVFTFTTNDELRVVDAHESAQMFVTMPRNPEQDVTISKYARLAVGGDGVGIRKSVVELSQLGIDILEDQLGWDRFAAIVRSRSEGIKSVLTNDEIFTGLGSLYADEVLFVANIRFDRSSESLSTIEIRRLHRTLTEVVLEAIKAGGTSMGAEPFLNIDGVAGSYQNQLLVVGREGLPCDTCRTPIQKVAYDKQPTYFCPKCQSA